MRSRTRWLEATAAVLLGAGCGASGVGDDASLGTTAEALKASAMTPSSLAAPKPAQPLSVPAGAIVKGKTIGPLPLESGVDAAGALEMRIPIDAPPAFFQTPIALVYSSRAGNGHLGRGWSLSAGQSSLRRCNRTIATEHVTAGVAFDTTDSFCLDGRKLVPVAGVPGQWQTEEWSDLKIVAGPLGNDFSPTSFQVLSGDGTKATYAKKVMLHRLQKDAYGNTMSADTVASEWLITRREDRSGNAEQYVYTTVDTGVAPYGVETVLDSIEYYSATDPIAHRSLKFLYDGRPDVSFRQAGGTREETSYLLTAIQMSAPNPTAKGLVWQYNLAYGGSPALGRATLTSVQKCGALGGCSAKKDILYDTHQQIMLASNLDAVTVPYFDIDAVHMYSVDLDGDGGDELILDYEELDAESHPIKRHVQLAGGKSLSITGTIIGQLDVEADGKTELLVLDPGTKTYRFLGWNGSDVAPKYDLPFLSTDLNDIITLDVDGDGRVDLAGFAPNLASWVVLYNHGDGTFSAPVSLNQPAGCGAGAMDVDGDGRQELLLWNPGCSIRVAVGVSPNNTVWTRQVFREQEVGEHGPIPYLRGDFNGDGLVDLLYVDPYKGAVTPALLRWNLGGTFSSVMAATDPVLVGYLQQTGFEPNGGANTPSSRFRTIDVHDWNGDGRDDLFVTEFSPEIAAFDPSNPHQGTAIPAQYWHVLLVSRGDGTFTKYDDMFSAGAPVSYLRAVGDFDGDGKLDMVLDPLAPIPGAPADSTSWQVSYGRETAEPDRVSEVRDEGAAMAQVQALYGRTTPSDANTSTCHYPSQCLMRGMPVVKALYGINHPYGEYFRFEDPRFDRAGRGFLGFMTTRTWIPRVPMERTETFDLVTMVGSTYPYVGRPTRTTTVTPLLDDTYALVGDVEWDHELPVPRRVPSVPARVVQIDDGYVPSRDAVAHTHLTQRTVTTWDTPAPVSIDDTPQARIHITGVLPNATQIQRTTSYGYDSWDNVTSEITQTTGGVRTEISSTPEIRLADWLLHLPHTRSVLTYKPGLPVPPPVVTTFTNTADGQALVASISVDVGGDPDQQSTQTFAYDANGQRIFASAWAPGRAPSQTHYVYADASNEGLFLSQVYTDLGLSRWYVVHPAYGRLVMSEDERGDVSTAVYDDLGRSVSVSPALGCTVSYDVAEVLDAGAKVTGWIRTATTSEGGIASTRTNLFGVPIEERRLGFDGQMLVTDTTYDANGRPQTITDRGAGKPGSNLTQLVWDSLGRARNVTLPNGSATWHLYTLLSETVNDPMSNTRTVTRDVDGRVVSVKEGDPAKPVITTFVNGSPWGPTMILDSAGNQTTRSYDGLGRLTEGTDPDSGHGRTYYDGLGDVRAQERGAAVTTLLRDAYGRIQQIQHPDGTTTTYDWDSAAGSLGHVSHSRSPDGTETFYGYDTHGRVVSQTWVVGGASYTLGTHYDGSGRVAQIDYPSVPSRQPMSVRYHRRAGGFIDDVEATDPAVAGVWNTVYQPIAYDPRGGLAQASFGNGVQLANTYDPVSGALAGTVVSKGSVIRSLGYTYWADGRLRTKTDDTDPANVRVEKFYYDALGRLGTWSLVYGGVTRPTAYTYDDLGNLTDVTFNGALQEHRVYSGQAGPHGLTQRQLAGGATIDYHYDPTGRLTSSSDGLTIPSYSPRDLPRSLTRGVTETFAYDADGARVSKTRSGLVTITVGGLFERRQSTAGFTDVFHVKGPGGEVAQLFFDESAKAETQEYVTRDRIGSVSSVTDGKGTAAPATFFDPFGNRIDFNGAPIATNPTPIASGFAGHDHDDELRLVNMKGRIYDPTLKRFLTPDPFITRALHGQSYNAYTYGANDPVNRVDPTGWAESTVVCKDTPGADYGTTCESGGGGGDATPDAPATDAPTDSTGTVVEDMDSKYGAPPMTGGAPADPGPSGSLAGGAPARTTDAATEHGNTGYVPPVQVQGTPLTQEQRDLINRALWNQLFEGEDPRESVTRHRAFYRWELDVLYPRDVRARLPKSMEELQRFGSLKFGLRIIDDESVPLYSPEEDLEVGDDVEIRSISIDELEKYWNDVNRVQRIEAGEQPVDVAKTPLYRHMPQMPRIRPIW